MYGYLKNSCSFLMVFLLFSCSSSNLREDRAKVENSAETNKKLATEIESLKSIIADNNARVNLLQDSLSKEIILLQSFASADSLVINNDLRHTLDSLLTAVAILEEENQRLLTELNQITKAYAAVYQLPGTKAIQVTTQQSVYDCYRVNLKETNLAFFWQDDSGETLRNFDALKNHLEQQGHRLVFAVNGGMYKPDHSPQGLYIQEQKELAPIDRRKEEYGNFYMQPNGVFLIDTMNAASLILTDDFGANEARKALYATQSGPMALIDGEINKKFNIDSDSRHIRNGVGIIDEYNIVFIISNRRVNLYDFARVFKDHFNCSNALYLDGAISQMYLPEIQRLQTAGNLGPLIGIYK